MLNTWLCLSKQNFLDDAERDKERYLKELEAYHQTEAYKLFLHKQQEKKRKGQYDATCRVLSQLLLVSM